MEWNYILHRAFSSPCIHLLSHWIKYQPPLPTTSITGRICKLFFGLLSVNHHCFQIAYIKKMWIWWRWLRKLNPIFAIVWGSWVFVNFLRAYTGLNMLFTYYDRSIYPTIHRKRDFYFHCNWPIGWKGELIWQGDQKGYNTVFGLSLSDRGILWIQNLPLNIFVNIFFINDWNGRSQGIKSPAN